MYFSISPMNCFSRLWKLWVKTQFCLIETFITNNSRSINASECTFLFPYELLQWISFHFFLEENWNQKLFELLQHWKSTVVFSTISSNKKKAMPVNGCNLRLQFTFFEAMLQALKGNISIQHYKLHWQKKLKFADFSSKGKRLPWFACFSYSSLLHPLQLHQCDMLYNVHPQVIGEMLL